MLLDLLKKYEPDGALHFSTAKHAAESPAHFRHAIANPLEPTKAMRIGTIVHRIVLGPQRDHNVVIYPGTRNGHIWELFQKAHANDLIVTKSEWAEAEPIAEAIKAHDGAKELLDGARFEVPIRWENSGIPCSTRGIDLVHDRAKKIVDLKTTVCAKPRKFFRQAERMFYHAQLAHYEDGALANGIDTSGGVFLIAAETKPPYPVQIIEVPADVREWGRRQLSLWIGTLRNCAEIDHWPAYSQSPVRWELPVWAVDDDEDDEDEAA